MNPMKRVVAGLAIGIAMASVAGCQRNDSTAEKGPAQKAGEQIDKATAKAAVEINKAAEQAGKGLQKAGESIQNTAKDAQSKNEKNDKN